MAAALNIDVRTAPNPSSEREFSRHVASEVSGRASPELPRDVSPNAPHEDPVVAQVGRVRIAPYLKIRTHPMCIYFSFRGLPLNIMLASTTASSSVLGVCSFKTTWRCHRVATEPCICRVTLALCTVLAPDAGPFPGDASASAEMCGTQSLVASQRATLNSRRHGATVSAHRRGERVYGGI